MLSDQDFQVFKLQALELQSFRYMSKRELL